MQRHSVASLAGATLDYWIARSLGLPKPIIVREHKKSPECLVEVDGTVFEPFSPTNDPELTDALVTESGVSLRRIGTPLGHGWAATTPTGLRFIEADWQIAALRALVAVRYGSFVFDEVEE